MIHSLSHQVSYYSEFIQKHVGWEYVAVYADEALTGTKEIILEFQSLLKDCRNGKIDMVITKSISRLARNTVTMLETVRELKDLNVDVYFEKENIHSLSGDGELMLTILTSFAQEESRSISENVTWGQRKRFADGKVSLPYKRFLGYEKGLEGLPKIVDKEAAVVRMIYKMFLE
jgi:site-specific DNA recombinase